MSNVEIKKISKRIRAIIKKYNLNQKKEMDRYVISLMVESDRWLENFLKQIAVAKSESETRMKISKKADRDLQEKWELYKKKAYR